MPLILELLVSYPFSLEYCPLRGHSYEMSLGSDTAVLGCPHRPLVSPAEQELAAPQRERRTLGCEGACEGACDGCISTNRQKYSEDGSLLEGSGVE